MVVEERKLRDAKREQHYSSDPVLDCRGLFCPEPVYLTGLKMQSLQTGGRLIVLGDDPVSVTEVTRWANRNGHKVVSITKNDGEIKFVLEK